MSADPGWLEVSLTVDGEMAEAVSEALGRFVCQDLVYRARQIGARSRFSSCQSAN